MANGRFQTIPATTTLADLATIQANWDKADSDLTSHQAQISQEVQDRITADNAHANSTAAHNADNITFTPGTSGISATSSGGAIREVKQQLSNVLASQVVGKDNEVIDAKTLESGYVAGRTITVFGDVLRDMQSRLKDASTATSALKHGLNVVSVNGASPLNLTISGKTLVNILGKDGGCESLTPFTTGGAGTVATSTTQVKQSNNSIKISCSASDGFALKDYTYPLDTTKQYILAGWVYVESYTSGILVVKLQDYGAGTERYVATVDTTKVGSWQYVYVKIPTANTLVGSGFRFVMQMKSPSTAVAYFDSIRIYELDTTTATAIGTTYTATTTPSIDDILPCVDGVKHVQGVSITKQGKNLLGPVTDAVVNANATIVSPYSFSVNSAPANTVVRFTVNVIPGQNYTFSYSKSSTNEYAQIYFYNAASAQIQLVDDIGNGSSGSIVRTVTAPANASFAFVQFNNNSVATDTVNNWQLELGNTATAFEAANPDYVYGVTDSAGNPLKLASSVDGAVKDTLFWRDGAWRKEKRWVTDYALDGTQAWGFTSDSVGYKEVQLLLATDTFKAEISNKYGSAVRYDGKILRRVTSGSESGGDQWTVGGGSNQALYITIADTDTGFDNAYIPAANEIQSYFNGWKVNGYTAGTTATNEASGSVAASGTYTLVNAGKYKSVTITKSTDNVTFTAATEGTDYTMNWNATKAVLTNPTAGALYYKITYTYGVTPNSWVSVVDGTTAPTTNTLTYVSANKSPNYTPYSLTYQLATTVEEVVSVEGSINLHSGGNQIEVTEGVIDREPVTPAIYSAQSIYRINDGYIDAGHVQGKTINSLSNRSSKIIAVYKNGQPDKKWSIYSGTDAGYVYGSSWADIKTTDYDQTAVYTVTYVIYANDKPSFTANCTDVSGDYNTTTKTILDNVNKKLADDETNITILQMTAARKGQGQWIAPTMLNAWVNFGGTDAVAGYMKDDFGWVNVKGRIKSGTIGQTAFTLPVGYRPLETQRFTVSSNGAFGELIVNPDGTIVPQVGSNISFNVQIRFRAEQ